MKDQTFCSVERETFLEKAPLLHYFNEARAYCFALSTGLSSSQAGRRAPLPQVRRGEETFWTEHS